MKKYLIYSLFLHIVAIFLLFNYMSMPEPTIKQVVSVNLIQQVAPPKKEFDNTKEKSVEIKKTEEVIVNEIKEILLAERKLKPESIKPIPSKQPEVKTVKKEETITDIIALHNIGTVAIDNVVEEKITEENIENNKEEVKVQEDTKEEDIKQDEAVDSIIDIKNIKIDRTSELDKFLQDNLFLINEPKDIDENLELSDTEKNAIKDKLALCWAPLAGIRDKDLEIKLSLNLDETGFIKAINVESVSKNRADIQEVEKISQTIKDIFASQECSSLSLPENKYNIWKSFSIKLTLKGFF